MIKQAPSLGRILAMTFFAFSCFAILLFLWLSFGGSAPLRAEKYLVKVAFPEAIGVTEDVDVRSAGINIGSVRKVELDQKSKRTLTTLAIDARYAPLASDAVARLRTKTFLGEAFVEVTQGTREARKLPDGGRLADGRVEEAVQLDEVFQTYDPVTRRAFQMWQQELGNAVKDRGEDLSDSIGQLPEFTDSGSELLGVLYRNETAVRGLVRDTGTVYEALTQDEGELRRLIVNSHALFGQTASQREALAEAFRIFPTFLLESRLTLKRLETFARAARPLVRDLRPVARELRPTIAAVRRLSPDLRLFFLRFDEQITVSRTALPALRQILEETRPLFKSLGPFLAEFNPILEWLELHQHLVGDFLGYAASALADKIPGAPSDEVGHYLRQIGVTGAESFAIHRNRLSSNRGNAYLPPIFTGPVTAARNILPNWDCKPSGGEVSASRGPPSRVACWLKENLNFQGKRQRRFAHVERADYSRSR